MLANRRITRAGNRNQIKTKWAKKAYIYTTEAGRVRGRNSTSQLHPPFCVLTAAFSSKE